MTDHHAAGHMTRFQCLGGACEDTCCIAWEVPVAPPDQARLRGALGKRADQLVTQVPDGRGGMLTVLRKLPDGACPELDGNRMCQLHAHHGERALPDTCATYPRMIRQLDDRLELTGLMSCPEVARLVLLADDGALVPTDAAMFGRATPQSRLGRAGAPPYFAMFATVRDALADLCADRSTAHSFASHLYFAAELVARISPFFHRGATVAEPERLAHELAEIRRPEVQAALAAKWAASGTMNGLALQTVIGTLDARGHSGTPSFEALMRAVAATYAPVGPDGANGADGSPLARLSALGVGALWRAHLARRPVEGSAHAARLDRYLARHSRNYWLQDWYLVSETLFEHVMQLALRVALLRFLLVAHPDFRADADDATCDRAAVEVFHATARAFDHNSQLRSGLSTTLKQQQMLTVEHCAAILKL